MAQPKPVVGTSSLAPGARVAIRDEEWIVRKVESASTGGLAVHVTGVSPLVQGKDYIFLDRLDEVTELRPEETELFHDDSPGYRWSRLYLESLLRRTSPTDDSLYLSPKAAINPASYQLQPAAKALRQPRPRILMADGVGLGKTIEVGILLTELIERGRGDRILVVALKSILSQFQEELWARFTIPLVRLDSTGIQRVQSKIPSNMNPFYYYDRAIISIDTLKRDEKYRRYLEKCHWDVVVIDECQNVAIRTTGGSSQHSQRARVAQLLAQTSDALILTSATPHDGRPQSFASIVNLLEPTAVADPEDYTSDEVEGYFLRRFKKDIRHEVQEAFQERDLDLEKVTASAAEDAVFSYLSDVEFKTIDSNRKSKGVLFRTLLLKAFLSSPAACRATIESRLRHKDLQPENQDPDAEHDRTVLGELSRLVEEVKKDRFSKYTALVKLLLSMGVGTDGSEERVVVFSERIDTLEFLSENLRKDLKLGKDAVAQFHGTLDDVSQQKLVKSFGSESSPIRILLGSDAASEGINLHFYCNKMVHFDLPWSLITLEQRNGRIDRYGQRHQPIIRYLLTIPNDSAIQGDLRVLERLIEKEDNAQKNLGDVAWLLDLHESEKEEERIAEGIQQGLAAEKIIPDEPEAGDLLDILFGDSAPQEPAPTIREPLRLYADDYAYARDAFRQILPDGGDEHVEWHDHLEGCFTLRPPEDLLRRFDYLPQELQRQKEELKLTTDRKRVMDALAESRQDESRWPEWQLFWEQHPVGQWLDDRVLFSIEKHSAPVLRLARGIEKDESVFLFQGIISNQRGQPAIVDWFGVSFRGNGDGTICSLTSVLERTVLREGATNPTGDLSDDRLTQLQGRRTDAVSLGIDHLKALRKNRAEDLAAPLKDDVSRLRTWKQRRVEQREGKREKAIVRGRHLSGVQLKLLENEKREEEKLFEERRRWIEDTMRTIEAPYLRLAAVLIAVES